MFERDLTRREVELLEDVARFVEAKHANERGHDYAHVLTVVAYAVRIARSLDEEVDPLVVLLGAFFHDLGWVGEETGTQHGIRGAVLAEEYLSSTWVSAAVRQRVSDVIVRHTRTSCLPPRTVEEKVVWDADGLAGLGLMGTLRGVIGGAGSTEEILEACFRFAGKQHDRLHLDESRRLAGALQDEAQEMVDRFRAALDQRMKESEHLPLP